MAWIHLTDGRHNLGEFDLPPTVTGEQGFEFRLRGVVRRGGNGVVFDSQVLNPGHSLPNACAVKFLRQQNQTRMDRFLNERRIMEHLKHERIASYFDHGEVEVVPGMPVYWVAMELGGQNLQEHVYANGPIELGQLVWIGSEMCAAITHLHEQGMIHRDIKPANFVWETHEAKHIKMIDFGIAKYIGEDVSGRPLDDFTQHLEFVGPAFFSSPELIAYARNKNHPVTFQSDLFQLGRVLWFLGTGIISAGVPSKKDCPAEGKLRDLVLNLVDDDPESRITSADDVAKLLQDI